MSAPRILIFAKAPRAGFAKTRLIPALGAAGAAALARQMLQHTLHQALSAGLGAVELCVTPAIEDAAWQEIDLPQGVVISNQGAGDLGERMARAAQRAIGQGSPAILIGSDCVEMSAALLRDAAQSLREHDAVIHCTVDGGYALLGIGRFSPLLFSDIPWSSAGVADMTRDRIGQLGWSLHLGTTLRDVDEPQDLQYLPQDWSTHAVA